MNLSKIPKDKQKYIADKQTAITEISVKQEGKCYICCTDLEIGKEEIIKIDCGHYFHYDCLYDTFKYNAMSNNTNTSIRECPYCRHNVGWLPLFPKQVAQPQIHIEYISPYLLKKIYKKCGAINKSGKRKGHACGCNVYSADKEYCGKHKNYKPPVPTAMTTKDTIIENITLTWYKNQVLLTSFL